jgi:hypothetical protein
MLGLPLVILSASSSVSDKVLLLEMVACDSLTVPFSPKGSADSCHFPTHLHTEDAVAKRGQKLTGKLLFT